MVDLYFLIEERENINYIVNNMKNIQALTKEIEKQMNIASLMKLKSEKTKELEAIKQELRKLLKK